LFEDSILKIVSLSVIPAWFKRESSVFENSLTVGKNYLIPDYVIPE